MSEIKEDGSLDNWGKQEILGVLDVHWVLRLADILKNSVKEAVVNSWKDDKETSHTSQQEKNMMKNFDKLQNAQYMVDRHYQQLSKELSMKGEKCRGNVESEFDKTFTDLKKAQCNLIKSIDQYKVMQMRHQLSMQSGENHESESDFSAVICENTSLDVSSDLSQDEIDRLVMSVQYDLES